MPVVVPLLELDVLPGQVALSDWKHVLTKVSQQKMDPGGAAPQVFWQSASMLQLGAQVAELVHCPLVQTGDEPLHT